MKNILLFIFNITQPVTVLVFVVAGLCAILLGKTRIGVIDIAIAISNFLIFYGDRIIK